MMLSPNDHFGLYHQVAHFWACRQHVLEHDELVSICWLAAERALPRHDPQYAVSTFLVPRLHGAVKDALRRQRPGSRRHPVEEVTGLEFHDIPASTDVEGDVLARCELDLALSRLDERQEIAGRAILRHGLRNPAALAEDTPWWTPIQRHVNCTKVSTAMRRVLHG